MNTYIAVQIYLAVNSFRLHCSKVNFKCVQLKISLKTSREEFRIVPLPQENPPNRPNLY